MNKNLMVSIMKRNGDIQVRAAEALGMSTNSFNMKLNEKGGREFNASEIKKLKERYSMTPEEVNACFFED